LLLQRDASVLEMGHSLKRNPDGSPASVIGEAIDLLLKEIFALSVVFGIFTLALIPLVQKQRRKTHESNYDVDVQCPNTQTP
jgi:hypothetical protein